MGPFPTSPFEIDRYTVVAMSSFAGFQMSTSSDLNGPVAIDGSPVKKNRTNLAIAIVCALIAVVGIVESPTYSDWINVANSAQRSQPLSNVSCATSGECIVTTGYGSFFERATAHSGWVHVPGLAERNSVSYVSFCLRAECDVLVSSSDTYAQYRITAASPSPSVTHFRLATPGATLDVASCSPDRRLCMALASFISYPSATTAQVVSDVEVARSGDRRVRLASTFKGPIGVVNDASEFASCVTDDTCFLVLGLTVLRTNDAGATWQIVNSHLPLGAGAADAISCATLTSCMIGTNGGFVLTTFDAGRSWRRDPVPGWFGGGNCTAANQQACDPLQDSFATIESVRCFSALHCIVGGVAYLDTTGHAGGIMSTVDGGRNWVRQTTPDAVSINSIDCRSVTTCVAVGEDGGGNGTGYLLQRVWTSPRA